MPMDMRKADMYSLYVKLVIKPKGGMKQNITNAFMIANLYNFILICQYGLVAI
jgi:hypothetical protein